MSSTPAGTVGTGPDEAAEWSSLRHFAGLDWAKNRHDVVVVDREGRPVADFAFEESAAGWEDFRTRTREFPKLALTIETSRGPVVERLLEAGVHVYPVSPAAAAGFRNRKAASGVKDDRLDAWSMAARHRGRRRPPIVSITIPASACPASACPEHRS